MILNKVPLNRGLYFICLIGLMVYITEAPGQESSIVQPAEIDSQPSVWQQRQKQIDAILPQVLPCVVSVEGGSGVIVTSQGLVLTAAHVVGATGRKVDVQLADGRNFAADVIKSNRNTDIAILKLPSSERWPHLQIADSGQIEPGQWVLAFGYPSSFPRDRPSAVRIGRILQFEPHEIVTDCPIMGGDSGGPLVDLNGQLVAIHRRVKNVITQNNHARINRQTIRGIEPSSSNLTSNQPPKTYLGLNAETDEGRVRVRSVREGGPAELAGLIAEDVILIFDDLRIRDFEQILQRIKRRKPGDRLGMVVNRSGELIRLTVTLGEN